MFDTTETTLNQKQYDMLRQCSETKNMNEWNEWRLNHPDASVQLVGADFENASLTNADLEGADLRAANLQGASLKGANLREANLNGAMFFRADLREVDLQGAFLYGADLSGVNLEGANCFDIELTKADFRGAKMSGLRLDSKANLEELAHPLSDKQMAAAVFVDTPIARITEKPVARVIEKPIRGIGENSIENDKVTVIRENQYRNAPEASDNNTTIVRSIVFDRENIQSGIGILSYFGEILRQKYEDKNARVIVAQEGLNVKFSIETIDGDKKIIEKALVDYIGVITGREQLSGFFPEPLAEFALKQKLDLVHLELKQTEVLHSIGKAHGGKRNSILDDSVDRFYTLLSDSICINR